MILQILKNTSNWKLNSTVHDWKNFLSANQIRCNCLSIAQYSCDLINFILFLIHKKMFNWKSNAAKNVCILWFYDFLQYFECISLFHYRKQRYVACQFFVTNPFVKKHYWAIDLVVILYAVYRFLHCKLSKIKPVLPLYVIL